MIRPISRRALCAGASAFALTATDAFAQTATAQPAAARAWPTRAATVIVPFAAGNAIDAGGRIVMEELSKQVGQPVVVENRAGAGGTVGAAAVARAMPDGYTLLLYSSSFS